MSFMRVQIFEFLHQETGELDRKMVLMTAASGISNAITLAVINASMEAMKDGGPYWQHFVLFGLSLALFVYALRYVLYESSRVAEKAVCHVRVRLADKIRRCDLQALEKIGENDIHARISRDTGMISQVARPLFAAAQAAVMVVFTMFYIATVSPLAMVLCAALILGGALFYLKDRATYEKSLQDSSQWEDDLTGSLTGLLKGFKEIRINQRKSDDVFADFGTTAVKVQGVRTRVMQMFADTVVFIEMFFVILLGAIVFVLPAFSASFSGSVTKIVAAVLFFFGPLGTVIMMIPVFSQVNVTVDNLRRLEGELDDALKSSIGHADAPLMDLSDFQTIRFSGVGFAYLDPDGQPSFQVGPIDVAVKRGEILFLVGGNGSGKTTFMKLFTALYRPTMGTIHVDETAIGPRTIQSYRDLFSAIFSDFYLFDKLHGLRDAAPERVEALLKRMGLADKTGLKDGRFTNTRLSTGQRKRLALVLSYLEEKAIYIFDEVAADQDPHFRAYFYETLLADLKQRGKTVIVVSHDDRYFHVGDRVLRMDYGTLRDSRPDAAQPGPDIGRIGTEQSA